jgi:hypothetical protein
MNLKGSKYVEFHILNQIYLKMCKWSIVHSLFVDYCWLMKNDNFILIEDIPMCLNSKSKTKCLTLLSKWNNSAQILVFYCGYMFQSY